MFFTKGVGHHKNKLQSFEMALRQAGVEKCNLVTVSSIMPPNCTIISREKGLEDLNAGEVVFVVMARESTDEPHRLVSSAIGLAKVKGNRANYGYLSEHHCFGQTARKTGDLAEDMAATMLATTLGAELDADKAWDERKQLYKLDAKNAIDTRSMVQSATGHKDGLWTTVIAMAVLLLD